MDRVNPTRMELILLKKKIGVARRGHSLLKKKRDAIVAEFFKHLDKAVDLKQQVNEKMKTAHKNLVIADAVDGRMKLKSASLAIKNATTLDVSEKNVMGVKLPIIKTGEEEQVEELGKLGTPARVSFAVSAFQKALETIISMAEAETVLKRLLEEITKTRRRVNALEYVIIPRLEEHKRFIQLTLDERERENFFKLKLMKG